ncbi:MAG: hypothetical protein JWM53_5997 [bacterium]|nr:hypothetical protein [bacterium]
MPNVNRQPTVRGSWVLQWDSNTVINQSFAGRGHWIDVGRLRTGLDVLDLVCTTKAKSFVSAGDVCALVDLLRIYLNERNR